MLSTHILKLSSQSHTSIARRWASVKTNIDKLVIANRGEIACRVMRTAKRLGVKTVAVYSDADKHAMHVAMADEAHYIGPPAAQESYLRGDKIIDVAKRTNSQAIHPGYGFLSENVEFSELCQKSNVIFIGPPTLAIRNMGIKSTSKAIMSEAGVPVVQGYHGEDQSNAKLKEEAAKIGYPIMVKAVRGGGGKGMRIVHTEKEFEEGLESARREAQKAFGDSVVLLESFIAEPRHVEVQVFGDTHGNCVYLFERDCSVQRRHQKIIEEAPAPGVSPELRAKLGLAAVRAAKAVGYVGAGTVEFILDRYSNKFYFMEMNTRLQVEHPITEMITGTDLVEWQIKIASGEELPVTQEDLSIKGHAFESRIYAENPGEGFMPGAGPLLYLSTPVPAEDVRVETGVRQGDEVSVHYDPMIAKLVVWGNDRTEALTKMHSKLTEYNIAGLETNVNFLLTLCKHPEFILGNVHTNFIRDHYDSLFPKKTPSDEQFIQAAVATILTNVVGLRMTKTGGKVDCNPFVIERGFRLNYQQERDLKLKYKDKDINAKIKLLAGDQYQILLENGTKWNNVKAEIIEGNNKSILRCSIDGTLSNVTIYRNGEILALFDNNGKLEYEVEQPKFLLEEAESSLSTSNAALAPMPGVLDKILVNIGDQIKKGDPVVVIIAMKMEFIVRATRDARVCGILHKVGENVPKDTVLVQFEDV